MCILTVLLIATACELTHEASHRIIRGFEEACERRHWAGRLFEASAFFRISSESIDNFGLSYIPECRGTCLLLA